MELVDCFQSNSLKVLCIKLLEPFRILTHKAHGKWIVWLLLVCSFAYQCREFCQFHRNGSDWGLRMKVSCLDIHRGHQNLFLLACQYFKWFFPVGKAGPSLSCVLRGSIMDVWIGQKRRMFWILIQRLFSEKKIFAKISKPNSLRSLFSFLGSFLF